jgi:hypothetical protein
MDTNLGDTLSGLLTALEEFDERNTSLRYSLRLSEDQENEDTEYEMNN